MYLYVLVNEESQEFKVGITNCIENRLSYWDNGTSQWEIHSLFSGHPEDIRMLEQDVLLSTVKHRTTNLFGRSSGRYNSGYSEVRDISVLDSVVRYLNSSEWLKTIVLDYCDTDGNPYNPYL